MAVSIQALEGQTTQPIPQVFEEPRSRVNRCYTCGREGNFSRGCTQRRQQAPRHVPRTQNYSAHRWDQRTYRRDFEPHRGETHRFPPRRDWQASNSSQLLSSHMIAANAFQGNQQYRQ